MNYKSALKTTEGELALQPTCPEVVDYSFINSKNCKNSLLLGNHSAWLRLFRSAWTPQYLLGSGGLGIENSQGTLDNSSSTGKFKK